MSGPTLVIELAAPPSPAVLQEFRALMVRLSSSFEEKRPGYYDVSVPLDALGADDFLEEKDRHRPFRPFWLGDVHIAEESLVPGWLDLESVDRHRPFLVYLMGPAAGHEELFDAEHEDEPEVVSVLGFTPTHAVNVSASCNDRADHVAAALLTAAVLEVVGGVAKAELTDGQAAAVAGLPGMLGITEGDEMVLGTAEFLRAWAGYPGFRLVK
ncbi:DUF6368 family protein [Kitasatospora sp. NPDC051853]|uniref:DUF6368 family protein n=1 Tax=Kitasatospora sp. NPDC051853 TaxID=3364058 RepID=UPI0037A4410D